jgi:uncharacterized protein YciI
MHIVILTYSTDAAQVHLEGHRAFLDAQYAIGVLLASGRQVPWTGGVLLFNGSISREELKSILAQDPLHREQIAEYKVITFTPTKTSAQLEGLT